MAKYTSQPIVAQVTPEAMADKFSDLTRLQAMMDRLPEEQRAKVGDVAFEPDAIIIRTPQVGAIRMQVEERTPQRVAFAAVGSPIPLKMLIDMEPEGDADTRITTAIDVEIPAMLRPFIGNKMQEAANRFGQMIGDIARAGNNPA